MHFKPMIAAALVMSLGLVANGVPIDSVAPVADVAPIAEATPVAPVANVAPVAPADGIAPVTGATTALKGMGVQGGVEGILWPAGFTRQCLALDKASKNLAILIERAKKETGYKCNTSQTEIINRDAGCGDLTVISSLAWPLAFLQQEKLSTRIAAQVDCIAGYKPKLC
ncbi:MAG: hypothetical protein J3R72DRAFT_60381 [Linnemannia gamsii]|nr:MAG: hypothetical protein J3R72DRAFT_60381 [Linnemannia gamsii]